MRRWLKGFWCFIISIIGLNCNDYNQIVYPEFIPEDNLLELNEEDRNLFLWVNEIRNSNNIPVLKLDKTHCEVALSRNYRNMDNDTISHDGLFEDSKILKDKGLKIGENLAFGFWGVQGAVNSWVGSEGHLNNILKERWEFTGISIKTDSSTGKKYYCQIFSRQ